MATFKNMGLRSYLKKPLRLNGRKNISIGNHVYVGYRSWLAAVPIDKFDSCLLEIGDGSTIGNFNHIYSTKLVVIGKKVLTADKVYISDNLHGYDDIDKAIMDQPVKQNKEVRIGDGSWIGENVCILGSSIGKNCVIGANAVVTRNLPDYCVAVGNPAKIIKRYCSETGEWKKTSSDGKFITES